MTIIEIVLLLVIGGGCIFGLYLAVKGVICLLRKNLGAGLAYILIGITLFLVLLVIAMPSSFIRARNTSARQACLNNLRIISGEENDGTSDLCCEHSVMSYADGKRFEYEVTDKQLLKTPVWRTQDDFPPLSPRKAEKAATKHFLKFVKDKTYWKRDRISLEDMGDGIHWIYVVEFSCHAPSCGEQSDLNVIVLMDGTVIEPKITDRK